MTIPAEQFIKANFIVIKGTRKDQTEYETLAVSKGSMWNSTIADLAKEYGVRVIDLRKQLD